MRKSYKFTQLILIFFLFSSVALSKEPWHAFSLEDGVSVELHKLSKEDNYFGLYHLAGMGGQTFSLYPNSRFSFMWGCDICRGETLTAAGSFDLSDSVISLTNEVQTREGSIPQKLYLFKVHIVREDFITIAQIAAIEDKNIPLFKDNARSMLSAAWRRGRVYDDWEERYDNVIEQHSNMKRNNPNDSFDLPVP